MLDPLPAPERRGTRIQAAPRAPGTPGPRATATATTSAPAAAPPATSCDRRFVRALEPRAPRLELGVLQRDEVLDDDERVARAVVGAQRPEPSAQIATNSAMLGPIAPIGASRRRAISSVDERGDERRHDREHQRGADGIDGHDRRAQDVRRVREVVARGRERARGRDAGDGLRRVVDEDRQPGADDERDADRGERVPAPAFAQRQERGRERRREQQRHDPRRT